MPESDAPELTRQWGARRMKAVLVLAATVSFVVSPFLSTGFNGFDPAAFPVRQDDPPVQPAGYAFSIWGVIYLWLLVHAAVGVLRRADDAAWDPGRWPLFVSLAIGAAWIPVANVSPPMATLMIWAMLIGALAALRIAPRGDRWLAQVPLALFAGWLTAASWVSVGLMLAGYGLLGGVSAALVVLPLATAFAVAVQIVLGRAPEYALAVIWALIAVFVANATSQLPVAVLAVAGIGAVGFAGWRVRS